MIRISDPIFSFSPKDTCNLYDPFIGPDIDVNTGLEGFVIYRNYSKINV